MTSDSTPSTADIVKGLRDRLAEREVVKVPSEAAAIEPAAEASDKKAALEAAAIADKQLDTIEAARHRAETQNIIEGNRDKKINRHLRWKYANLVFCYLVCYSIFVAALLVASGFKICGFSLPESVIDFLVGSTAAAAIGLVYAVTSGLFGNK